MYVKLNGRDARCYFEEISEELNRQKERECGWSTRARVKSFEESKSWQVALKSGYLKIALSQAVVDAKFKNVRLKCDFFG